MSTIASILLLICRAETHPFGTLTLLARLAIRGVRSCNNSCNNSQRFSFGRPVGGPA